MVTPFALTHKDMQDFTTKVELESPLMFDHLLHIILLAVIEVPYRLWNIIWLPTLMMSLLFSHHITMM